MEESSGSPILTGKVVAYELNLLDRLIVYLENGKLQIDNNNAIRPFAVGRNEGQQYSGKQKTRFISGFL